MMKGINLELDPVNISGTQPLITVPEAAGTAKDASLS